MVKETLIRTIKEKKELSGLGDKFINEKVKAYFVNHPQAEKKLIENEYNKKSKIYKEVVKEIRAQLREAYGLFQTVSIQKRRKLFEAYQQAKGRGEKIKALDGLLASHQSTKERKDNYKEYYETIVQAIGEPEHVIDLGCGYNPLSYRWLGCEPCYEASDIAQEDIDLLNEFFKGEDIDGQAYTLDLLNDQQRKKRLLETTADTVFMFKLIDTLEGQRRNITKSIIDELCENQSIKNIVATFPLRSVGGKSMREGGKDNWFSRYIDDKDLDWQRTIIGEEELYIITKKS